MTSRRTHLAFTLVELLVAISIIACLSSLLMPALSAARQRANTLKCVSNMRQIGVSAQLYVNEHGNRTPVIEPWPDKPEYSSTDGAQSILQAFGPYGVTPAVLQCPSDTAGPNYYAKEGASYQWFPMASGQIASAIKQVWMDNQSQSMTIAHLFLAFDYSAVHNGEFNVLFGDGHVATH